MKKLLPIILYALLCMVVVSLTSCVKDVMDEPTLSVSHSGDVRIPSEGKEVVIPLLTNQTNWQSICNAEWITLRAAGNTLLIEAAPNPTIVERIAEVLVIAGNKSVQLSVVQSPSSAGLVEVDPGALEAKRTAGEYRIAVRGNTDTWTVEKPSDVDWVKVFARPRYGEVVLYLDENKSNATRTCRLTIHNGGTVKAFEIHQEGYPHYFLPYMVWGSDFRDAEAFEIARHSRVTSRPRPANPLASQREIPDFGFSTVSSAFQQVRYEYLNLGTTFLYKATLIAADSTVVRGVDFKKFLADERYVPNTSLTSTDLISYYEHPEKGINLQVTLFKDSKEAQLIFTPIVEQDKAYTLPERLPMGFPITEAATKDEVEAWETKNGGELSAKITEALGVPFYFAPEPYYSRQYMYDAVTNKILDTSVVTLAPEYKGMYRYGGLTFITKEMGAIITAAGFKYHSHDMRRGAYFYHNEAENLRLAVSILRMGGMELTRCQFNVLKKSK
ncbi:Bacteroidetes-Associated Carbohydrate-binding Often N-terminal [Porphyromonas cangingivalis]|uniref:BACON domain-containing protein n=1 Tax=Porphyromonas cangingivalis TaxID=36874 RepID=UPI000D8C182F|nr:BACON domain-containing protein [Porphyromonas cangingivalis]SPY35219.1 Bacteroidetes-Associated Carbohydrate-binding Often N-terminal [Porphyromonas cangingivalis]